MSIIRTSHPIRDPKTGCVEVIFGFRDVPDPPYLPAEEPVRPILYGDLPRTEFPQRIAYDLEGDEEGLPTGDHTG